MERGKKSQGQFNCVARMRDGRTLFATVALYPDQKERMIEKKTQHTYHGYFLVTLSLLDNHSLGSTQLEGKKTTDLLSLERMTTSEIAQVSQVAVTIPIKSMTRSYQSSQPHLPSMTQHILFLRQAVCMEVLLYGIIYQAFFSTSSGDMEPTVQQFQHKEIIFKYFTVFFSFLVTCYEVEMNWAN